MKLKKIIITLCLIMAFAIMSTGCRPLERRVPETPRQTPEQQLREDQIQDDEIPRDGYPREELPGVPPEQNQNNMRRN